MIIYVTSVHNITMMDKLPPFAPICRFVITPLNRARKEYVKTKRNELSLVYKNVTASVDSLLFSFVRVIQLFYE